MPVQDFKLVDPFTQIYGAIRDGLMADTVMAPNIIKPGNFPDVTDPKFFQFKEQLSAADTPDVILIQGKFALKPFGSNSRVVEFVQQYPIFINYDNLSLSRVNLVKFRTTIALRKLGGELGLRTLVKEWHIEGCEDDGFGQRALKRDQIRWMQTLTVSVNGYLDANDIQFL